MSPYYDTSVPILQHPMLIKCNSDAPQPVWLSKSDFKRTGAKRSVNVSSICQVDISWAIEWTLKGVVVKLVGIFIQKLHPLVHGESFTLIMGLTITIWVKWISKEVSFLNNDDHCPRHVPDMASVAFVPIMSNLFEVVVDSQLFNLIRC